MNGADPCLDFLHYLHSSRNPLIQRNLTVTSRLRKHFTSFEGFLPQVSKINLILNTDISFQPQFLCTKPLYEESKG